jgi:hypothetical protein
MTPLHVAETIMKVHEYIVKVWGTWKVLDMEEQEDVTAGV